MEKGHSGETKMAHPSNVELNHSVGTQSGARTLSTEMHSKSGGQAHAVGVVLADMYAQTT